MSTTRFSEAVGPAAETVGRIVYYSDFAEFFAEFCASEPPIVPLNRSVLR